MAFLTLFEVRNARYQNTFQPSILLRDTSESRHYLGVLPPLTVFFLLHLIYVIWPLTTGLRDLFDAVGNLASRDVSTPETRSIKVTRIPKSVIPGVFLDLQ